MAKIPRAYGGVCFMTSLVSGNYLLTRDAEKLQREYYFSLDDMSLHKGAFESQHR